MFYLVVFQIVNKYNPIRTIFKPRSRVFSGRGRVYRRPSRRIHFSRARIIRNPVNTVVRRVVNPIKSTFKRAGSFVKRLFFR